MSVLDDFVRMRLYRRRAAELEMAAGGSLLTSVQNRYLVAADHYWQVADAEEHAERARALGQLVHRSKTINQESRFSGSPTHKTAFRRAPLSPLDLTEEVVRVLLKIAAYNARLRTRWSPANAHIQREGSRNSDKMLPSLPRHVKDLPGKISSERRPMTRLWRAAAPAQ